MNKKLPLFGATLGLCGALLSACTPVRPPADPSVPLTFRLPEAAATQNLKLAAIYFEPDGTVKVLNAYSDYGAPQATERRMMLHGFDLKALANNVKCAKPFASAEAKDMQSVTITPSSVNTCNIYFVAFEDADGDGKPTASEQRYITHDIYSFASAAFSYSMKTPDGKSTETGTRRAGWSLVRHLVLQPSSTPGQYLVSMNSVPTADENIAIVMHEPSDFMTSMSLPALPAGGAK